jgi:hypothetical protein
VADLFQPVSHVDGELWTANSVNRIEQGVESLDVAVDTLEDRVDALGAAGGPGGGSGQVLSGPRSSFSPAIGTILLDTSLTPARYIGGYGTEWRELNGTAITSAGGGGGTPEPGTGSAPVLTSTVTAGGTIGAINLTWTAVSGATSYKVYETESPAGVSGATALTTTSSTRTPSTARNYEYWVTATVNGVESASSNRIQAVLPFVEGGGTHAGPGHRRRHDRVEPVDVPQHQRPGKRHRAAGGTSGSDCLRAHVDIDPNALKTYVNSPYYTMNPTGTAVQFQVFMNGGKTSANTKYPRSELREYATGSTTTKAAWSGTSGRHIMRGKTKLSAFCAGEARGDLRRPDPRPSDDILHDSRHRRVAPPERRPGGSRSRARGRTPLTNVALGQEVSWDIRPQQRRADRQDQRVDRSTPVTRGTRPAGVLQGRLSTPSRTRPTRRNPVRNRVRPPPR